MAHFPVGDRLAIGASLLCVVHCLMLPIAFAALPALTSVLPVPESFHRWMVALAVPVSTFTLLSGWRRHGRALPLLAGVAGLGLMIVGAVVASERTETLWTVAGSLLVAGAHLRNLRCRS